MVGVEPELLSGEEEGRLSFLGATADLDPADGPFLVFDIGGGSTEFSWGTTEAERTVSVDMGCVRMTEAFLHHDPPLPEELSQCISVVEIHLDDVVRAVPEAPSAATFVGLAGTVSTAVAVELGLAEPTTATASTTSACRRPRSRTSSGPSPPSRSPTGSTTRASSASGPMSSSVACACWWR